MPDSTDFLEDYVQVKDRVKALFELYGQARIETAYEITREPDDRAKVICRALVFRNPEDMLPASVGTSWLYLPGTTNFTKGSEIENAETSAVGRAIGFLGILTEKGLASANEIANKQGQSDPELQGQMDVQVGPPDANGATEHLLGIQSFQGTVKLGTAEHYKLEVQETPEGPAFGFRLEMASDKAIPQVIVQGDPAIVAIAGSGGDPLALKDHWVRVKGSLFAVRAQGRRSFNRLRVSEIQTREWAYPPLPASSDPSEAGTTAKAARADEAVLMPEDAPQTPASSLTKGGASADDPTLTRPATTGSTHGSTGNPSGASSGMTATPIDTAGSGGPVSPSQTAEALPSVPDDGGAGAEAASMSEAAPALCRAVGSDFGTVCSLLKGHPNKHREMAIDGRVLASW